MCFFNIIKLILYFYKYIFCHFEKIIIEFIFSKKYLFLAYINKSFNIFNSQFMYLNLNINMNIDSLCSKMKFHLTED